jgi:hypothetical protein
MTRTRASTSLAIATALTGSALSLTLAAPIAHADPVLQPIIGTVQGDRGNTPCPQFNYSGDLEAAAQAYARSENMSDYITVGNYKGTRAGFLGSGDPQAAAINSAYTRGAGNAISNCSFRDFGVGFVRHEDRSVDVVTIVFGEPAAPPPVTTPTTPPPVTTPTPPPPTATVTSDVDLYDVPGGGGNIIGHLRKGQVVTLDTTKNSTCPPQDWCVFSDPKGAAWGFVSNN